MRSIMYITPVCAFESLCLKEIIICHSPQWKASQWEGQVRLEGEIYSWFRRSIFWRECHHSYFTYLFLISISNPTGKKLYESPTSDFYTGFPTSINCLLKNVMPKYLKMKKSVTWIIGTLWGTLKGKLKSCISWMICTKNHAHFEPPAPINEICTIL